MRHPLALELRSLVHEVSGNPSFAGVCYAGRDCWQRRVRVPLHEEFSLSSGVTVAAHYRFDQYPLLTTRVKVPPPRRDLLFHRGSIPELNDRVSPRVSCIELAMGDPLDDDARRIADAQHIVRE